MPRNPKWQRLTPAEYAAKLSEQGGGCAICGNPPKTRRLDEDHDHKTGRTRGLLCHRCNRALPQWVTAGWLLNAAAYLNPAWLDVVNCPRCGLNDDTGAHERWCDAPCQGGP